MAKDVAGREGEEDSRPFSLWQSSSLPLLKWDVAKQDTNRIFTQAGLNNEERGAHFTCEHISYSGDSGNLYWSSSFQLPNVTSISAFPPPSSPHHLISAAIFMYRLLRNRTMTVYLL